MYSLGLFVIAKDSLAIVEICPIFSMFLWVPIGSSGIQIPRDSFLLAGCKSLLVFVGLRAFLLLPVLQAGNPGTSFDDSLNRICLDRHIGRLEAGSGCRQDQEQQWQDR